MARRRPLIDLRGHDDWLPRTDLVWDPERDEYVPQEQLAKHLPGKHDQKSHGSWAQARRAQQEVESRKVRQGLKPLDPQEDAWTRNPRRNASVKFFNRGVDHRRERWVDPENVVFTDAENTKDYIVRDISARISQDPEVRQWAEDQLYEKGEIDISPQFLDMLAARGVEVTDTPDPAIVTALRRRWLKDRMNSDLVARQLRDTEFATDVAEWLMPVPVQDLVPAQGTVPESVPQLAGRRMHTSTTLEGSVAAGDVFAVLHQSPDDLAVYRMIFYRYDGDPGEAEVRPLAQVSLDEIPEEIFQQHGYAGDVDALISERTNDLVASWAQHASDHDQLACALQDQVAVEFGLDNEGMWEGIGNEYYQLDYEESGAKDADLSNAFEGSYAVLDPQDRLQAYRQWRKESNDVRDQNEPFLKAFAHAVYDATQEEFARQGIDELSVHRGVHYDDRPEWWTDAVGDYSEHQRQLGDGPGWMTPVRPGQGWEEFGVPAPSPARPPHVEAPLRGFEVDVGSGDAVVIRYRNQDDGGELQTLKRIDFPYSEDRPSADKITQAYLLNRPWEQLAAGDFVFAWRQVGEYTSEDIWGTEHVHREYDWVLGRIAEPTMQTSKGPKFHKVEWLDRRARHADPAVTRDEYRRSPALVDLNYQSQPSGLTVDVDGANPISSFSTDMGEADRFAKMGNVGYRLSARVPVGDIFSTALTGLGCLGEQEVIVMGLHGGAVYAEEVRYWRGESPSW